VREYENCLNHHWGTHTAIVSVYKQSRVESGEEPYNVRVPFQCRHRANLRPPGKAHSLTIKCSWGKHFEDLILLRSESMKYRGRFKRHLTERR